MSGACHTNIAMNQLRENSKKYKTNSERWIHLLEIINSLKMIKIISWEECAVSESIVHVTKLLREHIPEKTPETIVQRQNDTFIFKNYRTDSK